jgi:hypothetical protein
MDTRLQTPWLALKIGIGMTATLAGLDKFFNILADWPAYVSPLAASLLPFSTTTFMSIVGVIEVAVGVAILGGLTRLGAYVAAGWLLAISANLVLGGFLDVAVRDTIMALAAFALARMTEVRAAVPVAQVRGGERRPATITA